MTGRVIPRRPGERTSRVVPVWNIVSSWAQVPSELAGFARAAGRRVDRFEAGLNALVASIDQVRDEVAGLREAFDGSNREICRLREDLRPELAGIRTAAEQLDGSMAELSGRIAPLEADLAEVREVVEPLEGASARIGRLTDRLPGGDTNGRG